MLNKSHTPVETVKKLGRMAEHSIRLSRGEEADFPNFHAASMMNDAIIPHSTRPSESFCLYMPHSFIAYP